MFSWAWELHEFLRIVPANEMAHEFARLEGINTSSGDEFAPTLGTQAGSLPRESLLEYVDRGITILVGFQRRLQG